METVSIIVPIYNVEDYLDDCVQSLRRQTYTELEILLVDDGSPDRCGILCDRYAQEDARIRVIHKENGGLGDARNVGAQAATGTYLLFIDSDDWLEPDAARILSEIAEETQADLVLFDYEGVEPGGKRTDRFSWDLPEGQILNVGMEPRLITHSVSAVNKLYRRTFWEKSGIPFPTGRHYEDLGTLPKLFLLAERVVYCRQVLYNYRMREGSIMHGTNFERNFADRTAMLSGVRSFYREQGAEERFREELEYLFFENGYFIPSREIVLNDRKSPWLDRFRSFVYKEFPDVMKNRYIGELSKKDRILLFLLKRRWYGMMVGLSQARQWKERLTSR